MLFAHLNFNTSFNTSLNSIAFPLLRPHFSVTYRPHLAGFSPTYIFIFTLAVVVSGRSTNVLVCSLTFWCSAFSFCFCFCFFLYFFVSRSFFIWQRQLARCFPAKVARIAHTPCVPRNELMYEIEGILFGKYLAWLGNDKALALASPRRQTPYRRRNC